MSRRHLNRPLHALAVFPTWVTTPLALAVTAVAIRRQTTDASRDERGQTTAEYALVLIGAVAVAVLLIGWVTGSGKIGELFDAVFDNIISKVR